MRCISCGYDLLGLDASGKCPECGDAIARSERVWRLEDTRPIALQRMLVGIRLVSWSTALFVPCLLLLAYCCQLPTASSAWVALAVLMMLMCVYVTGWGFLVTRALRTDTGWEDPRTNIVRLMGVGLLASVMLLGTAASAASMHPPRPLAIVLAVLLLFLFAAPPAFALFHWTNAMRWIRVLGNRVPESRISRTAGMLRWLVPLSLSLTMILWGILSVTPQFGLRGTMLVVTISTAPLIVVATMSIVMLQELRKAIDTALADISRL